MSARSKILPALLASVTALGGACSDAKIEPVPPPEEGRADNKLKVSGSFCTTDPDELRFPVKVLFIIDTSQSMGATDPEIQRLDAILQVIDATQDIDGVEIGIVTFGAQTAIQTERCTDYTDTTTCEPGFMPASEAIARAPTVSVAGGTTDFVFALQTALGMLATDMALQTDDDLQNARYSLVFLSDGLPDTDARFDAETTCEQTAAWELNGEPPNNPVDVIEDVDLLVRQIAELARQYDVRELSFNTAFASTADTDPRVKACGASFMRAMSKIGQGVFRDFSSGEDINFLFVDFTSFKRVFALKNFTATNVTAKPFSSALGVDGRVRSDDPTVAIGIIDSDADGISDQVEDRIGTDSFAQDTDGDGFSDLLEFRLSTSGLDPLDPTDADCKGDVDKLDTDGDGLRDCEEIFFGVLRKTFDTDNDGFGDGIEVLFGTNPGLPDTLLDIDFDGVGNATEMRSHSRVDNEDVAALSEHAYRYRVTELGVEGSTICYDFVVDNISLASTAGATGPTPDENGVLPALGLGGGTLLRGENRIIFEVTENPFDAPNEPGVARLACARARFDAKERLKDPANGEIIMPRNAFKPATEFDPDLDCIDP